MIVNIEIFLSIVGKDGIEFEEVLSSGRIGAELHNSSAKATQHDYNYSIIISIIGIIIRTILTSKKEEMKNDK